jgi:hypothetical protein
MKHVQVARGVKYQKNSRDSILSAGSVFVGLEKPLFEVELSPFYLKHVTVVNALRATFVFAQWWDFETLHCPT